MVPKLEWRQIGRVKIMELQGILTEPWLNRNKQRINQTLEINPASGLLINLREVERIDRPGAEVILKTVRLSPKGGILGQNLSTYFVAENMQPNESIPIFEKEKEAIGYFQKEFAEAGHETEKRQFSRISTALPVEFEFKTDKEFFYFEAVVLNLSEGGLWCQFLDTKTEALANRVLDPYDLKMLNIRLTFHQGKPLRTEGKVLRAGKEAFESKGVAVQFYHLSKADQERIRLFLNLKGNWGKNDKHS